MKTKKIITFMMSIIAFVAVSAQAIVPIAPFPSIHFEDFDGALLPGAYQSFMGFNNLASFSSLSAPQDLIVAINPPVLPALSLPHVMAGDQTNIRIRFARTFKQFGGYFRVLFTAPDVDSVAFRFYREGLFVGSASANIHNDGWEWAGYDLADDGGFDMVLVLGNGIAPGGVGLDELIVR